MQIQLVGQKKALDTLKVLSSDLQQNGVRSSLRVAAKPIQTSMQGLAPDDSATPGSMLRSAVNITVAKGGRKVRTGTGDRVVTAKEGETAFVIGPNKKVMAQKFNKSKKIAVGFIGWFAEKGTKAHKIGDVRNLRLRNRLEKAGLDTGKFGLRRIMKIGDRFVTGPIPHPGAGATRWMNNALASSQSQTEAAFYSGLEKWIAKNGR